MALEGIDLWCDERDPNELLLEGMRTSPYDERDPNELLLEGIRTSPYDERDPNELLLEGMRTSPYDERDPNELLLEGIRTSPYDERDPNELLLEGIRTSPCYDERDPGESLLEKEEMRTHQVNAGGHQVLKTENEMLKYQLEMKANKEEVVLQEFSRMRQENERLKEKFVQRKVSGCYPMKSMPHGIAVIINNEKFKLRKMNRVGTDKDARGLEDLFTYLGFSLHRHDNLTGDEMMAVLAEVATMDHSKFDYLIVAILTHGREGNMLYGTDTKEIAVRDIIDIFRADNCPSLAGKPKIILLQACRGALTYEGTISSGTVDFMEESLLDAGSKTKNSRRKDTPLHDMITEVIEQVSSLSTPKGEKQVPQFKSSLRLKLYFNPEW